MNTAPTAPHTHLCDRCGTGVMLMRSGDWSTGYGSHLATTCDGVHLHTVVDPSFGRIAVKLTSTTPCRWALVDTKWSTCLGSYSTMRAATVAAERHARQMATDDGYVPGER